MFQKHGWYNPGDSNPIFRKHFAMVFFQEYLYSHHPYDPNVGPALFLRWCLMPRLGLPLAARAAPSHEQCIRGSPADLGLSQWWEGLHFCFQNTKAKETRDDFNAHCNFFCHAARKRWEQRNGEQGSAAVSHRAVQRIKKGLNSLKTYSLTASQAGILQRCTWNWFVVLFAYF